jgi:hypothetical protein
MVRSVPVVVLWAAAVIVGPVYGADDFSPPDLRSIQAGTQQMQRAHQDSAQAALADKLAREAKARKAEASLLDADLLPSDLKARGWKEEDFPALAEAISLASKAVKDLHDKYPSAVADAYGNGTMTNIEDSFKLFGGGNLERGCLSHQAVTFSALGPLSSVLEVKKLMVGKGLEHHAVIVYPKGTDWQSSGVVLDGWPNQSAVPKSMTFTISQWQVKFFALRYLALNPIIFQTGPRLED